MMYLKINGDKYIITNDGIQLGIDSISLTIQNRGYDFATIQDIFSSLDGLAIYGCIEQDDGTCTDEYQSTYYDMYTKLTVISYNFDSDTYTIVLAQPDEVSERLDEIEEILNEILMEGGI